LRVPVDRPLSSDRLLPAATVARRLDVCPETVRLWCRTEKIPAVRTPTGRYFVSSSIVERLRLARQDR
jgi:predicted site-specific integrase-resolvase